MELSTAVGEFAEMLAIGSQALERLAKRQAAARPFEPVYELLGETQDIALRLSAIAAELRKHQIRSE